MEANGDGSRKLKNALVAKSQKASPREKTLAEENSVLDR